MRCWQSPVESVRKLSLRALLLLCAGIVGTWSAPSLATECWGVSNINGYSAYADQGHKFGKDGLPNQIVICFTPTGGTVSGADLKFVKCGASTLAGFAGNEGGNESFEIYQIDRERRKLLYTKSRIGTKSVMPIFSDAVAAFVGDAKMLAK